MATEVSYLQPIPQWRSRPVPAAEGRPLRVALFARHSELFGAERSLLRLAVGFAQWPNYRPLVAVPAEGSLSERCRAFGIEVAVCGHRPWVGTPGRPGLGVKRLARNLRIWPRLMRRLARFSPDVIYTSTASVPIGAAAARHLGIAHVWHLQELYSTEHPVAYDCGWHLSRQLMRAPYNRLVGNSDAVRAHFAELLDRRDIATIYEGFDFPPLPRNTGSEKYRSRITEAPVIELASVGVLTEGKGQDDAILAVADLIQRGHRVHLSIAGEGDPDFMQRLRELTRRHRLEQAVSFLGFIPDPSMLYEQAAITLVCARAEGFGRAAVESLSRGTPVVGTDAGGLPEILRPGRTGLLYPPGDWRALSDRIQALIQDADLYAEIATTGAAWSRQRFPARRYVREMGELLTHAAMQERPQLAHEISRYVTPVPHATTAIRPS